MLSPYRRQRAPQVGARDAAPECAFQSDVRRSCIRERSTEGHYNESAGRGLRGVGRKTEMGASRWCGARLAE